MRALVRCAVLMAGLALCGTLIPVHAQSEPASKSAEQAEPSVLWGWANFFILAGALGYLIAKYGGPWFASRSVAIRKGIADAEEIRAKAEAKAAEVDGKLARLGSEIESLKSDAHREQAAEAERIRQQTTADLERLREHAASEIVAAGKAARLELKRYGAHLAIDLAEQKIRRQMTPELQTGLVESFARDLGQPGSGPHANK